MNTRSGCVRVALWVSVCVWLVGLSAPVRADLILGNGFGPPYQSGTVFNDGRTLKGVGLEMKSGQTFAVDRFSVELEYLSGSPEITGHIYINNGTIRPQDELLTMNTVNVNAGTAVYDFVPGVSFTLFAGQKYWFILSDGPSAGWARWSRHEPQQTPAGDPANFLGYTFSEDNGMSWTSSTIYNNLQIHGTYIPAPALAGVCLAGLMVVWRRRA